MNKYLATFVFLNDKITVKITAKNLQDAKESALSYKETVIYQLSYPYNFNELLVVEVVLLEEKEEDSVYNKISKIINDSRKSIKMGDYTNVSLFERKSFIVNMHCSNGVEIFTMIYEYEKDKILELISSEMFNFENDIIYFNISKIGETVIEFNK